MKDSISRRQVIQPTRKLGINGINGLLNTLYEIVPANMLSVTRIKDPVNVMDDTHTISRGNVKERGLGDKFLLYL